MPPINVVVLAPFKKNHMERLQAAAGPQATITQAHRLRDSEALSQLLKDADAIIGEPDPAVLADAPRLKWMQITWAGTDRYTREDAAFPSEVRLTNVAGAAYGHIISQYVVAQILSLAQNLPAYVRQQEKPAWRYAGPVMTLDGAQALIFGAGDLGASTARRLTSFNVTCTGVCRDTSRHRDGFHHLVTLDQAEELLGTSDVVVCCLPHTEQTAGYLDERRLGLMKEGSILVNVGRGSFVDCDALARRLVKGMLRGAALDVTNPEPLPPEHPLWREPRCVITPHVAGRAFGSCDATEDIICDIACENLRRFIAGEPLTHVVL